MKRHILPLLLLGLSTAASAEPFDDLLSELGNFDAQGDSASFMSHVTWQDEPTPATYVCKDWADIPSLTIIRDKQSLTRFKDRDQAVIYGVNGDIEIFSITNEAGEPFFAAYFIFPSGETHLFRVGPGQKVVRESRRYQCERSDNVS